LLAEIPGIIGALFLTALATNCVCIAKAFAVAAPMRYAKAFAVAAPMR